MNSPKLSGLIINIRSKFKVGDYTYNNNVVYHFEFFSVLKGFGMVVVVGGGL